MIGYIYLIIDLTNWKKYVGQHHYHLEKLDSNYHGSGHIIKNIYKKRPETLKEVYLKTCYTQEELDEWEKYYIKFYDTLYPNGYNLSEGGEGGIMCEEIRKKMSLSHKGKPAPNKGKHHSEEAKKKISEATSGEKNPFYGKHHSEETKQKISDSHKEKHHSEETKRKISESIKGENHPFFGTHRSEETKQKLREYRTGLSLSEETKRKMSESHKGKQGYWAGKHFSEETKRKISKSQ